MRIDDLARAANVATTTIRLYQSKGLLAPPLLEGRTGYYDNSHLARLRVIARLQDEGFSLAGIASLLDRWERGEELSDLVGAESRLAELLGERHGATLTAEELLGRFPAGSMQPELIQRAASLGLLEASEDGRFEVADIRFIETGSALAHLGVPLAVILDEWEHLSALTDTAAARFADLFETHVLPAEWQSRPDAPTRQLAESLGQLRSLGDRVLLAAIDRSVARVTTSRFAELMSEDTPAPED